MPAAFIHVIYLPFYLSLYPPSSHLHSLCIIGTRLAATTGAHFLSFPISLPVSAVSSAPPLLARVTLSSLRGLSLLPFLDSSTRLFLGFRSPFSSLSLCHPRHPSFPVASSSSSTFARSARRRNRAFVPFRGWIHLGARARILRFRRDKWQKKGNESSAAAANELGVRAVRASASERARVPTVAGV